MTELKYNNNIVLLQSMKGKKIQDILDIYENKVNSIDYVYAIGGSSAIALYAIYGHTMKLGNEWNEFYGMRVPNDLDIYAKYYSSGQSIEYIKYVKSHGAKEAEHMASGQYVKTQNGVDIHLTRPLDYIVLIIDYMEIGRAHV